MDTINVMLKTGYKIVKDLSVQHKPVSFRGGFLYDLSVLAGYCLNINDDNLRCVK